MSDISKLVKDVIASPLGDVIASVGQGVAEAQQALDEGSLAQTLEIYSEGGDELLTVLKEIGYTPTFYTLPETTAEVKVALKLSGGATGTGQAIKRSIPAVNAKLSRSGLNIPGLRSKIYATPVDAGYANRYAYQADVSATLNFKIMPVPAPSGLENIRLLPNLLGKTVAEAKQVLNDLELVAHFVDTANNDVDEPINDDALVTKQEPAFVESNTNIVSADDTIDLTISS